MSKGGHIYRIRKITPARRRRMFIDGYIFSGVRAGISQAQMARQIEGIAGGDPEALKTVPPKALEGVVFPQNFTYSREAVRKRVHEILKGVDKRELSEWRKVVNERCEESWMSLYPSIIRGDTDAINSGMRLIATQGRALGFWVDRAEVTQKLEVPGESALTREHKPPHALRAHLQRARNARIQTGPRQWARLRFFRHVSLLLSCTRGTRHAGPAVALVSNLAPMPKNPHAHKAFLAAADS